MHPDFTGDITLWNCSTSQALIWYCCWSKTERNTKKKKYSAHHLSSWTDDPFWCNLPESKSPQAEMSFWSSDFHRVILPVSIAKIPWIKKGELLNQHLLMDWSTKLKTTCFIFKTSSCHVWLNSSKLLTASLPDMNKPRKINKNT